MKAVVAGLVLLFVVGLVIGALVIHCSPSPLAW
jgi:hypothetical protein